MLAETSSEAASVLLSRLDEGPVEGEIMWSMECWICFGVASIHICEVAKNHRSTEIAIWFTSLWIFESER